MTLTEFLEKLRKTPGPWELTTQGYIRCGFQCPITAVHGRNYSADAAGYAARWIGLEPAVTREIVRAADGYQSPVVDMALRQQLLQATVDR